MSIPRAISNFFKTPQKLEQEILELYSKNKQTKSERVSKLELAKELYEYLKENFRTNIHLMAVGSTVTKLGICYSDLDLCVVVHPLKKYGDDENSMSFLVEMKRILAEYYSRKCESVSIIPSKTVSIIRMKAVTFKSITFDVDISVNNITGIRNSHLLHHYSLIDRRFCILTILIKEWAINAGIGDSRQGTFSGYCLALLVLHFLQVGVDPPVLPNLQLEFPHSFNIDVPVESLRFFQRFDLPQAKYVNKHTLSELLIRFFDYYANCVDFENDVLSISSGLKKVRQDNLIEYKRRSYVYIEELYDISKNAAKRINDLDSYEKIKQTFSQAFSQLKQNPHLSSIGINNDNH